MKLSFSKMQGIGNDFVVIDATRQPFALSPQQIQRLADRHRGIGFDQLLVIAASSSAQADFDYRIFNADGSEAEQCGNGARCIARYIHEHGLSNKKNLKIKTSKSLMELILEENGEVTVSMGIPTFVPKEIPFLIDTQAAYYSLPINDKTIQIGAVAIGNPHAVTEVNDIKTALVKNLGPLIESHSLFPNHVNAGFMQIISPQEIYLRVYERGAGETLACGSGACAAVVIGRKWGKLAEKVLVHLPGGDLKISWQGDNHPVWMTGPAEEVFTGNLEII